MTDRLKEAFECIRAEDSLKSDTMRFLREEIQKRGKKNRRSFLPKRLAAVLSCVAVTLLSGLLAYNIYITPAAYVDLDVNPAIELTLNRFDRVVSAHAYNADGTAVISAVSVKHKSYADALIAIMDTIAGQGYLQDGGLVSVTLQIDDETRENAVLSDIRSGIERYIALLSPTAQVDVFPVSVSIRGDSYEQGLTPAKYLAILELIEVDPSASVENCRGHSISEIKELTKQHANHHGDTKSNTNTDENPAPAQNNGGHHGNSGKNGGHGGGHGRYS